jgi:hypothetical protein
MSSAGVFIGRCLITAFIGFSDFGKKEKKDRLLDWKCTFTAWKSNMSLVTTRVPFLELRNSNSWHRH